MDEFFAESRLRDKTALQHLATVTFEPHVNGIVEQFTITKVTPGDRPNETRTVTLSAQVKLPDGSLAQKTIVLTMAQRPREDDPSGKRWVVTGFMDAGARPPS